ncbi:fimbrial protein [Klebsiella pneumoniae]|uniref:fimbrial protein n=1 Tax=Klebsiella pneumoniae TaxID=573 RepID=UPI00298E8505|nr:fimbrial protein [Klebsiella pneumoniae]MDW7408208.1 fimbrial protein [Klebsiella pneumoniae]
MRLTPVKGLLALFMLWTGNSQAANVTCRIPDSKPAQINEYTFNGFLSAGDELPVGTMLYSAKVSARYAVECTSPDNSAVGTAFDIPNRYEFISIPTRLVPGILDVDGNNVYETNIPGIGVSVTTVYGRPEAGLPSLAMEVKYPDKWQFIDTATEYYIRLIKTGPVSPGVVNAINFPQVQIVYDTPTAPADVNISGFPIRHTSTKFNGTIQIVESTCKTEVTDMVVDLGSYEVKDFKRADGYLGTPWKDAILRLKDCQLRGYYGSQSFFGPAANVPGEISQPDPHFRNKIGISVRAMSSVIAGYNSTMALTPSPNNATGVGIQVRRRSSSDGSLLQVSLDGKEVISVPPPPIDTQSIEYHFIARYVAISDVITPGKANGAVVYTLNYY